MSQSRNKIVLIFFILIFGYAYYQYHFFFKFFFEGPVAILTSPFQTIKNIETSNLNHSIQEGLFLSTQEFEQKLPNENSFFLSLNLIENEMLRQRMIEINFPKSFSQGARCGFLLETEKIDETQKSVIAQVGGFKIVCAP